MEVAVSSDMLMIFLPEDTDSAAENNNFHTHRPESHCSIMNTEAASSSETPYLSTPALNT
jgi:hypothetical protein